MQIQLIFFMKNLHVTSKFSITDMGKLASISWHKHLDICNF